jgi:hypothetical protein
MNQTMATEAFIDRKFSAGSLDLIEKANVILNEYQAQNLVLTLRQLYYQFVARGMIPNKQSEYKRLGAIISDARLAGLVDWEMMEDRTRFVRKQATWRSPAEIVEACATQYREDLWQSQRYRPEVWIEKDALVGVIEAACNDLRVSYFACRGNVSQSAQYEAGKRFQVSRRRGQEPVVFHLGDHDPSGIDMTRDNADRLSMFARIGVSVRRLALNMDQVRQYNPPPNPAKESDSRFAGYLAQYGDESWELDALDPTVIDTLIRDNVNSLIDRDQWEEDERAEQTQRAALESVSTKWDDVLEFVRE